VQVGADARLSTLSGSGRASTWLLDPTDFTISAGSSAQTTSGIGATTLNTQLASTTRRWPRRAAAATPATST
jgi:hypothetical protein